MQAQTLRTLMAACRLKSQFQECRSTFVHSFLFLLRAGEADLLAGGMMSILHSGKLSSCVHDLAHKSTIGK
jgi:hypothetical protein